MELSISKDTLRFFLWISILSEQALQTVCGISSGSSLFANVPV